MFACSAARTGARRDAGARRNGASPGRRTRKQPSAAAIATAKELITVKGAAAIYDPLVPGVIEQAKGMFLQTNPMLAKDLERGRGQAAGRVRRRAARRSSTRWPSSTPARFTEQELKDALAFYKSPLGRKMIVEEPKVLDQSMRSAQAWADKLSEEIIGKMRAEMKKRGHDI